MMTSSILIAALVAGIIAVGLSESLESTKEHMLCGKRLIASFRRVCNVESCGTDSTLASYKEIEQGENCLNSVKRNQMSNLGV
ncbi:hypothetical protein L596_011357 [Steinernema carpocapsae]|uniref:Uncharacterized protein n=1 Tax=Steinernema carpocapsae TaxID=34508 RepID=A0A4U5NTM2_STECR|nr:hypothetical protein L596_011357 [Steinernema carpocapsae]